MRVSIDRVGRLVVPKRLREELGLSGPAEVVMVALDGRLELTVADVSAHVAEQDGFHVIVTDQRMTPMTVEETRDAIERVRR